MFWQIKCKSTGAVRDLEHKKRDANVAHQRIGTFHWLAAVAKRALWLHATQHNTSMLCTLCQCKYVLAHGVVLR
jgi:hypothetical protein